jgi:hypothetical protein
MLVLADVLSLEPALSLDPTLLQLLDPAQG